MSKQGTATELQDPLRRKLLSWTPPLISAVVLPVHAQTSACMGAPIMTATTASKCSGAPPIGEAVVTIFSDSAEQIEIRAIMVSGDSASDTITLPALPADVIDSVGIDIQWTGPASDATSCLPTSSINFEVSYGCVDGSMDEIINFDLTTVLAAAIP